MKKTKIDGATRLTGTVRAIYPMGTPWRGTFEKIYVTLDEPVYDVPSADMFTDEGKTDELVISRGCKERTRIGDHVTFTVDETFCFASDGTKPPLYR